MPRRLDTLKKVLGRERIFTSRILSHALCSPDGVPVFVGASFARCIGQYVLSRGRILLDDGPAVAVEFDRMTKDGYTIKRCEVKMFISPNSEIRGYEEGCQDDDTEKARYQAEERARRKAKGGAGEKARPKGKQTSPPASPARRRAR